VREPYRTVEHEAAQAERLRHALVAQLERQGTIRSPRIAAAMRAVPRHAFVPALPLTAAYRDEVVPVKISDREPTSTLSQPTAIATMLEQLQLAPGLRVLEVGTGTGYNAALLSVVAGSDDLVTTIDLDADLAERARGHLAACGHAGLRVLAGDGFFGAPARAPFDRIELSVATRVLSPYWLAQLADGGLLVGPLHVKGLPFLTPAFRKHGERLVAESIRACTFVLMRGAAASPPATFRLPVRPELRFVWESSDEFPAGLLTRILKKEGRPRGDIPVAWAAATYVLLTRDDTFYAETDDHQYRGIALFDRDTESLASVISASDGWGSPGVITYGGDTAYDRLGAALDAWTHAGRPGLDALRLTAVPSGAPVALADGAHRIPKPHVDIIAAYATRP